MAAFIHLQRDPPRTRTGRSALYLTAGRLRRKADRVYCSRLKRRRKKDVKQMAQAPAYLKSLKSESVVQRVVNCLTDAMVSRQLKPGDKLPTELELASTLGVARTSVREATKILTYLGVLEGRRSEGTFVCSGFRESMIDPMVYGIILGQDDSSQDLMELRELTEVGILRLAAAKHCPEDDRLLEEKLQAMRDIAQQESISAEDLFLADNAFHDAVALVGRNALVDKVSRVVRVLTCAVRHETVEKMVAQGKAWDLIRAHERILEILRTQDMEHLNEIIRTTYFLDI